MIDFLELILELVNVKSRNEHEYIKMGNGFTHSGTCKKCKKELESTIRKVVKEEHSQW